MNQDDDNNQIELKGRALELLSYLGFGKYPHRSVALLSETVASGSEKCESNRDDVRVGAEEKSLEIDAFAVSILNSISSEIGVLDAQGIIVAVNQAWTRFSLENAIDPGKLVPRTGVGSNYLEICQPRVGSVSDLRDAARSWAGIIAVLEGRIESFTYEYSCHSENIERWFSMSVTPLELNCRGVVISHTNITDRKVAETRLQDSQKQLAQSSQLAALGEISAGIAHEINNPLAIIAMSLDRLPQLLNEPDKFNHKVDVIRKSCHRIDKIIKGLKRFSRFGEGNKSELHDLYSVVKEVLILTESKAKQFNASVTLEGSPTAKIKCNEIEVEQVIVNLISNAIDAVKALPEKWVRVSLYEYHEFVVMRVMDSGNGIPEKVKKKMFEPFFTTKQAGEGTGLGLSISKGILDKHGATISIVEDCPNTCFEIRFPEAKGVQTLVNERKCSS